MPFPASANSFEKSNPAGLGITIMPSSISDLDGLAPSFAVKLKKAGIRTTEKLLETAKSLRGRQMLAEETEIDEKQLLRVANLIDRMRIKGVGQEYAELLEAVGVVTLKELRYRNPARLAKAMADANVKRKLVRALPSEHTVERWIDHAKKLPMKISY
jgi:predicted flap endonuclease-1-like 5' DNA nuclease